MSEHSAPCSINSLLELLNGCLLFPKLLVTWFHSKYNPIKSICIINSEILINKKRQFPFMIWQSSTTISANWLNRKLIDNYHNFIISFRFSNIIRPFQSKIMRIWVTLFCPNIFWQHSHVYEKIMKKNHNFMTADWTGMRPQPADSLTEER